MSWPGWIDSADSVQLSTFGVPFTFTPQNNSAQQQQLTGIVKNPAMAEDFIPGQGTSVVRLFVRFANIIPAPQKGDQVTLGGIAYNVLDVETDVDGGAVLKLRTT